MRQRTGLECVVSGKIQGRRETDDSKGTDSPPSPDVYVLPWSDGPTREKGEVCCPQMAGLYRELAEAGTVLSEGEWQGQDSRARGEHGAKGKVLPEGGRGRFQTRPATKNAECSGYLGQTETRCGQQLSPAGRKEGAPWRLELGCGEAPAHSGVKTTCPTHHLHSTYESQGAASQWDAWR